MRVVITILLICGFVASSSSQPVFSNWNASKSDIKEAASGHLISESTDKLVYRSHWMKHQVIKKYVIANGNLKRSIILFNSRHKQKDIYIKEFKKVDRQLQQIYGTPRTSDPLIVINEKLARNTSLSKGEKLWRGGIGMESEWATPNTYVRHTMRGNGYEIIHVVIFSSSQNKSLANGF